MDEDTTNTSRTIDDGTPTAREFAGIGSWSLFLLALIFLYGSTGLPWQFVNGGAGPLAPITGGAAAALLGLIAGAVIASAVVLTVDGSMRQLAFGLTVGFSFAATVAIVTVAQTLTKDVATTDDVTLADGAYLAIIAMLILIAAAALGRRRL